MDTILLISIIILFVFLLGVFSFMFFDKKNKKEVKKEDKSSNTNNKDEQQKDKTDDIPEILKDVTLGNYMHDLSAEEESGEVVLKEDENLDMPPKEKDIFKDIDDAFKDVEDLGKDLDDEIEDDIQDIDNIILDDTYVSSATNDIDKLGSNEKSNKKTLTHEYKNLSKEMKTIIITNVLNKKE